MVYLGLRATQRTYEKFSRAESNYTIAFTYVNT